MSAKMKYVHSTPRGNMFRNVLSDNHRKLLHTTKSPGNHKNLLLSKEVYCSKLLANPKNKQFSKNNVDNDPNEP